MEYSKDLSIVISLFNEEESLPELVRWIETVMKQEGYKYEIIMVDDGSRDGSWDIIKGLSCMAASRCSTSALASCWTVSSGSA